MMNNQIVRHRIDELIAWGFLAPANGQRFTMLTAKGFACLSAYALPPLQRNDLRKEQKPVRDDRAH